MEIYLNSVAVSYVGGILDVKDLCDCSCGACDCNKMDKGCELYFSSAIKGGTPDAPEGFSFDMYIYNYSTTLYEYVCSDVIGDNPTTEIVYLARFEVTTDHLDPICGCYVSFLTGPVGFDPNVKAEDPVPSTDNTPPGDPGDTNPDTVPDPPCDSPYCRGRWRAGIYYSRCDGVYYDGISYVSQTDGNYTSPGGGNWTQEGYCSDDSIEENDPPVPPPDDQQNPDTPTPPPPIAPPQTEIYIDNDPEQYRFSFSIYSESSSTSFKVSDPCQA
jgi:hypothetical protein